MNTALTGATSESFMINLPTRTWGVFGFEIREYRWKDNQIILFTIRLWSIVIPLTLLSAYLLLSKPRQRKTAINQAEELTRMT